MKRIDTPPTSPLGAATWIATCVEAQHPTLTGRIRCAIDGDPPVELWLPTLHGLAVRAGDRVLLTRPANGNEPIAVGVVDGFARRPQRDLLTAAKLTLLRDECVVVESQSGRPLLSLRDTDEGPVARLLQDDVHLEIEGALRIDAKSIALAARQGEAKVEASSDVVVKGETIRLN